MMIEEARRFYAEEIRAVGHLSSDALVAALARVPREAFLGAGPWQIGRTPDPHTPYRPSPDADPRHVYHNVLVAIDPERQLNNGMPSALASWIEGADIRPGDRVLHVGAGVGYYTAIMAELAGSEGRVVAYEVDPGLAARAAAALRPWPAVTVETGDASAPRGPFDAIFINAGCTHPRPEWLAALAPGGRLVVPLTVHMPVPGYVHGIGGMVRIERRDPDWPASVLSAVGIYDCVNARDPANEAELRKLIGAPGTVKISAMVLEPHERGDACVAHLSGCCFQK